LWALYRRPLRMLALAYIEFDGYVLTIRKNVVEGCAELAGTAERDPAKENSL
jgi:hypothetical protein